MNHVSTICAFLLLPYLVFAGTVGKIKGKISASETGIPISGSTIIIIGTSYEAVSDTNGDYYFLAVPVGIHSLKAQHDDYQDVLISNIVVNIDRTTSIDFALPAVTPDESVIEIVAETPIIQSNTTNSISTITAEEILYKPLRGYRPLVALAPGAVTDDHGLTFVRGGRIEETAYYIDGVYQNNLHTGIPIGNLSAYALQEVSVQAGGFNAEYGFAASGIVNATTKNGGPELTIFGEVISDEWLSQSVKHLGTFSYGYNVANLAISGPLPLWDERVRFFASLERNIQADATPSAGIHPVLIEDRPPFTTGVPTPGDIDIVEGREGPIPDNQSELWIANANISVDLAPFQFKIGGNLTSESWDEALLGYMLHNSDHNPHIESFSQSLYLQTIYDFGTNTIINGQINYFEDGVEYYDAILKGDIVNYGDKTDYNNDGFFNPDLPDDGVNINFDKSAHRFAPAGRIYDDFTFQRSSYIGGKFDVLKQFGPSHELKTGFEFRYHTLKRYRIMRPIGLARSFVNNPFIDPVLAYARAYTDAYGYDLVQDPGPDGNLTEGNLSKYDQAKHPIIAAFYVQDKIETSDVVINLGLRLDYFDANGYSVSDPLNIRITPEGLFDRSQLRESKTHITVSPRLGAAFPLSDHAMIYGQFGLFSQQPPYELLFRGWEYIASEINLGGGVAPQNSDLGPVRTTAYELGFRQQIGDFTAVDIAFYYKQLSDLVRLERLEDAAPTAYYRYKNGDYGTIKGLSLNLIYTDQSRFSANLTYTLQYAASTGSDANSNELAILTAGGIDGYPTYVAATDFDQRHSGRLSMNLQFGPNEGPSLLGINPLENINLGLLFSFGSGFPYTPLTPGDPFQGANRAVIPRAALNSAYGPWQYQLDMLLSRRINWSGINFDIYLWAINILGAKNWDTRMIYGTTGSNSDTGYLGTADGKNWIAENGGEPAAGLYRLYTNSPNRWAAPRQLRLGIRFKVIP